VPLVGDFLRDIRRRYPGLDRGRTIHELTRRLITAMVEDVIATGIAGLEAIGARSAADVRAADHAVVAFSSAMAGVDRAIKEVLFPRLYRHPEVMRVRRDAERVVRDLFGHYVAAPDTMPEEWCAGLAGCDSWMLARRVGDYIAGMTDRFAIQEHRRLFKNTPELR